MRSAERDRVLGFFASIYKCVGGNNAPTCSAYRTLRMSASWQAIPVIECRLMADQRPILRSEPAVPPELTVPI
jgi:hypothetical protein